MRPQCAAGAEQVRRGHLRSVHPDLQHRSGTGVVVGVGETLVEALAALGHDGPARQRSAHLGGGGAVVEVAGQGQHTGLRADRLGGCSEGVEQGRSGDLGRGLVPDGRGEPRLAHPGHRGLRHHEHPQRAGARPGRVLRHHANTFQKSRAVLAVPFTEPDTFERVPSARGWYVTSCSRKRHPASVAFCSSSTG